MYSRKYALTEHSGMFPFSDTKPAFLICSEYVKEYSETPNFMEKTFQIDHRRVKVKNLIASYDPSSITLIMHRPRESYSSFLLCRRDLSKEEKAIHRLQNY